MTDTEILTAILQEIQSLNRNIAKENRPTMTTGEAAEYLRVTRRDIGLWHQDGTLPNRYGSQRSGYKYPKVDIVAVQTKLVTGEVKIPTRRKAHQTT